MKNQQPSSTPSKAKYPTILGTIFFYIFNLILLTMAAWLLLEMWFAIQILFLKSIDNLHQVKNIIESNIKIIRYNNLASPMLPPIHSMETIIYNMGNEHIGENFANIFLNVMEIILTRACIFIEWLPFMGLILGVSAIDGLVLRDKRKFQGARESTFVFHRLKTINNLLFFSLFFIYMVIPYCSSPLLFLLPITISSSVFTALTIKNFKKYL